MRLVLAATRRLDLRHLQRLRAVREHAAHAGQRGLPRLGDVPAQGLGLGSSRATSSTSSRASTGSAARTRPCSCYTNLRFYGSDDDATCCSTARRRPTTRTSSWSPSISTRSRLITAACSCPRASLGFATTRCYEVEDLLTGAIYCTGAVGTTGSRLDPTVQPAPHLASTPLRTSRPARVRSTAVKAARCRSGSRSQPGRACPRPTAIVDGDGQVRAAPSRPGSENLPHTGTSFGRRSRGRRAGSRVVV